MTKIFTSIYNHFLLITFAGLLGYNISAREALLADLISCEFRFGARVQEPTQPYPYQCEDVSFVNSADDITLSGTLTVPDGQGTFPVVVLVGGYGKIDRNANTLGHKYFLVLADYLTRQGIAVLRFDKRGVGKSTGDFKSATSADLARDVSAAVDFLKQRQDVDTQKIGLIGHSEGGLVSAIVCSERKDIAFAVLLAPALAIGVDDIVHHAGMQLHFEGASKNFIEHDKHVRTAIHLIAKEQYNPEENIKKMRAVLQDYRDRLSDAEKAEMEKLSLAFTALASEFWIRLVSSPAIYFFMHYDVVKMLRGVTTPLLLLYGSKDGIASYSRARPIIKQGLKEGGNKNYKAIELSHLNHYFQTAKTGALKEYGDIEETMSPKALETILSWIKSRL